MIKDFFNLIFPRLCCACNTTLLKNEEDVCLNCIVSLPKTNFHSDKENPVNKVFWGRVDVEMATSFYLFKKKSRVQKLLHNLKYNGVKEVGFTVGKLMGWELKKCELFSQVEVVVPVPLHKNKLKKRGYNQSEWIAKGVSEAMNIDINTTVLYRKQDSQTQTKKSRYQRWENVGEIFAVSGAGLAGKSVLLVDDVITTGATLEACAQVLLREKCKIYIATIAYV